jgi:hypothetical protein
MRWQTRALLATVALMPIWFAAAFALGIAGL